MPEIIVTEEKKELKPNYFQILRVETWVGSDGKTRIRKTDSGFKEINGVRMEKWKKHDKPWLHITSIPADSNIGQPLTAVYKVTTGESVNSPIDTSMNGNFKLNIKNETNQSGSLRIKATLTNGEGSITITPKSAGRYKLTTHNLSQTQMNGEIVFDVLDV